MNPQIIELAEKVQIAENQKKEIEALTSDQEALKQQKIEEHEQLLNQIQTLENTLTLTSAGFEEEREQEFNLLKERILALQTTQQEIDDLRDTVPQTPTTPPVAPPVIEEEKSSFWNFGKLFSKKERKNATMKNVGRLVVGGAIAGGIRRGWNKLFGSSEKSSSDTEQKSGFFKKALKWLGLGALGVGIFSQWDKIKGLWDNLRGKEVTTSNEAITNKEAQEQQRQKTSIENQQAYNSIGDAVICYHQSLNPDYTASMLNQHHPETTGITPMLLDGMYDDIGDMHSVGALNTEKWKKRRNIFNNILSDGQDALLNHFTPGFLRSSFGLSDTEVNSEGISAAGWQIIQDNREGSKDELRLQQTQGFTQTKVYLTHVEGQLVREITKQELEKQNQPSGDAAIDAAIDDDAFQEQYVEGRMKENFYDSSLADLGKLLKKGTFEISDVADHETQATAAMINEAKESLTGRTFEEIKTQADIAPRQAELLAICAGAIELTKDAELREETNIWFSDVFGQLLGTDDALEERVKENLGSTQVLDGFASKIGDLSAKIQAGTATIDDIKELKATIDQLYQFQFDIKTGQNMAIDIQKRDGVGWIVNIQEAGETLVEWTFREHDGARDYALTTVGIGVLGYAVTHPRRTAWFAVKGTFWAAKHGVGITGALAQAAMRNKIRRMNYRLSSMPGLRRMNFLRFGKNPEAMFEAFKLGYISLDDAANIVAQRSTKPQRYQVHKTIFRALFGSGRKETTFSSNIQNNKTYLLKSVFTDTTSDYGLLQKHIDQRAWRELLFKRGANKGTMFVRIQEQMKKYDELIKSNTTTAQAKRILRTLSETRSIPIQKLEKILSHTGIDELNKLTHMDDVQMKKFTQQLAKHGSVDKAIRAAAGEVIQQAPELLDLSKVLTGKANDLVRYADTLPGNQTLADSYKRIAGEMSKWNIDSFAPDQAKQYTQLFDGLSGQALGELFRMGGNNADELLDIVIKNAGSNATLSDAIKNFLQTKMSVTWSDDMIKKTSLFTDIRSLNGSSSVLGDIAKYGDELLGFMKTLAKVL